MNRYTKLTYGTLNDLPLPELPFEQLGALIGNYQKQKDFYDQQKDASFKVLSNESDQKLAKEVNEYQDNLSSQLADIYMKGDTKEYMASLRGGVKNLLDLRRPGGAIAALESRYDQAQKVREELDEQFKDDANKMNYEVALSMIDIGDINYDAEARTYSSINKPTLQNFFDISERVDEAIKLILPEEYSNINLRDGYWWKEITEKYDVRSVIDSIMREPEVQEQMRIKAVYDSMKMSDEQKQAFVELQGEKNRIVSEQATDAINIVSSYINSNNAKDVKQGQSIMAQLGFYKGAIDGVTGDQTEQAFQEFSDFKVKQAEQNTIEATMENFQNININQQKESYYRYFRGMRPDKYDISIEAEHWQSKLKAQSEANRLLFEEFFTPPVDEMIEYPNPVTQFDMESNISDTKENLDKQQEMLTGLIAEINKDEQVFTGEEANNREGLIERAVFAEQLKVQGLDDKEISRRYAEKFGIDDVDRAAKQVMSFNEAGGFIEGLQNYASLTTSLDMYNQVFSKRAENFLESDTNVTDEELKRFFGSLYYNPKSFSKSLYYNPLNTSPYNLGVDENGDIYSYDRTGVLEVERKNLGVTVKEVQAFLQEPGNIKDKIKTNPKMATLFNVGFKEEIQESLGSEIGGMTELSSNFGSKTFEKSNIMSQLATAYTEGGFDDVLIDPYTGGPSKWKTGNQTIDPSKAPPLELSNFTIGVFNNSPSITLYAKDEEGKIYTRKASIDEKNMRKYQKEMQYYTALAFNQNRESDIDDMIRLSYPTSSLEAKMFMSATVNGPDVKNGRIFFDNTPPKNYNYKVLKEKSYQNANGDVETYKVIVAQNAQTGGGKIYQKYFLVDGNNKAIESTDDGFDNGLEALHRLNKIDFMINQPMILNEAKSKGISFTAQEAAGIGMQFPTGVGQMYQAGQSNAFQAASTILSNSILD